MTTTFQEHQLKKGIDGYKSKTFCFIDTLPTTAIKFSIKAANKELPKGYYLRFKYLMHGTNPKIVETINVEEFNQKYIIEGAPFLVKKEYTSERLILEMGLMLIQGFVSLSDNAVIDFDNNAHDSRISYNDLEDFDITFSLKIEDPFGMPKARNPIN